MKPKNENERIKEIEKVYETIGLQNEETRKYFSLLSNIPNLESQEKKATIFIEADTISLGTGEFANAGLESNS